MIDLSDQIQELRLEIRCCGFTRRERASAQARLDRMIAEHTARERALDAALEALDNTETIGVA